MIDFIAYVFSNLSGGDFVLLYLLLGCINYFLVYSFLKDINTASLEDKGEVLLKSIMPVINIMLFVICVLGLIGHYSGVLFNKMNNIKLF